MDADLAARARQLRADGMTYAAIAEALTIPITEAWAAARDGKALMPRGERHWKAVLDRQAVRNIRELASAGASQADLARDYGVEPSTIWKVIHGVRWSWLDAPSSSLA